MAYVLGVASALFNGSFTAVSKLPSVLACRDERFPEADSEQYKSVVFTVYTCFGVMLSSWLVLPFMGTAYNAHTVQAVECGTLDVVTVHTYSGSPTYSFNSGGLIAGGLFVFAIGFSFAAIPMVGISVGQGVWGGSSILVSFLWGVLYNNNKITSLPGAMGALALLIVGVFGIAFCEKIAIRCIRKDTGAAKALLDSDDPAKGSPSNLFVPGVMCAMIVGIFGGSILVPMTALPASAQGLVFVPSFGIGTGLLGPVVGAAFFGLKRVMPKLYIKEMLLPGLLSGTIWNAGNVASIFATQMIGLAVAYPLMQCALFFGGLWGIFVFHELTGRDVISVFFVSAAVLITGAGLLGLTVEPSTGCVTM